MTEQEPKLKVVYTDEIGEKTVYKFQGEELFTSDNVVEHLLKAYVKMGFCNPVYANVVGGLDGCKTIVAAADMEALEKKYGS